MSGNSKSGRKLLLNEALIIKIADKIKRGNFARVACQYAGIGEKTYYTWLERAEKDEINNKKSIFTQFKQAIKEADAIAEDRNVQLIQKAAMEDGSWQASAWYLERKHSDRWANKVRMEHSGYLATSKINLKDLTIEQLAAITALNPNDKNLDEKINGIVADTKISSISSGIEKETAAEAKE